jgi:hypothetical protein
MAYRKDQSAARAVSAPRDIIASKAKTLVTRD